MFRGRWTKAALFVLCLLPICWVGWRAWHEDLTANPIEYITHFTGDWAIRFIVLTLAVTPLRKLLRAPDLLRFRRMFGLYAFTYASLHFLTWLWFDKDFDLHEMAQDVLKRSFITAGFLGLILMLPLAVTSTNGWIQRLGAKRWQKLHRAVYITAIAAVVHYYWLVKSDIRWPAFYGAVVVVWLGARLVGKRRSPSAKPISLKLGSVRRETKDTVTLRFPLPSKQPLAAKPGQFLTFNWMVDGKKVPRSYSISSSPLVKDYIEITVKQQGIVSSFLNRDAKPGLVVEANGPFGQFYFDERLHPRVVLFAGGSGVTPIMSMLRYIEEAAPHTDITLFYAVRTAQDIIFEEDLTRLQIRMARFRFVVIASQADANWRGRSGYISRAIVEEHLGPITDQTFFLCGPPPFMGFVKEILASLGVPQERVRQERFTMNVAASRVAASVTYSVEFAKSGVKHQCPSSALLLTFAESHGIDIPNTCRVGQCGTCATRVLDGEVDMEVEDGLDPALREQGYRLMCVARPRGDLKLDA